MSKGEGSNSNCKDLNDLVCTVYNVSLLFILIIRYQSYLNVPIELVTCNHESPLPIPRYVGGAQGIQQVRYLIRNSLYIHVLVKQILLLKQ